MTIDLRSLSDNELSVLMQDLRTEVDRRRAQPVVDEVTMQIMEGLREQGTIPAPATPAEDAPLTAFDAWVDPGTDHAKMYLLGDRVQHGGRLWESTHPGLNHWEPGTAGVDYRIWADITTPTEGLPEGVQAWVPGLTLVVGDLVIYETAVYEVVQAHTSRTGWEPPNLPALFKAV